MNKSSIKTTNSDSPKTPGGISKSLLTPCRRVGLSRKWKKGGVSPFISPLSSTSSNQEIKQDNLISKRKKCNADFEETDIGVDASGEYNSDICNTPKIAIDRTPIRTALPRKKIKALKTAQKCSEEIVKLPQSISELNNKNILSEDDDIKLLCKVSNLITDDDEQNDKQVCKVSKLSRKKSERMRNTIESSENELNLENIKDEKQLQSKDCVEDKSPNSLTKECIVVIQSKMFKGKKNTSNNMKYAINIQEKTLIANSGSQTLFDSDSDDIPLSNLNTTKTVKRTDNAKDEKINEKDTKNAIEHKTQNEMDAIGFKKQNSQNIVDLISKEKDKNDFNEKNNVNIKRIEKTTSTTSLCKTIETPRTNKPQKKSTPKLLSQSSNSFDDDDDFDYDKSKTILIKRTYNKVTKPLKMKSTGSITQKDIDDLKARIESKKNLLLAKTMTNETKELRDLIKKWQLGCQTALTELLDLMKKKMPDQNIEHSQLLQMLKIPPDLVGYESDSDCFNTPDDSTIILSALKLN